MTTATHAQALKNYAETIRALELEAGAFRIELAETVKEAHKAGATIKQLQDWTGYSRRSIYYMLEDKR